MGVIKDTLNYMFEKETKIETDLITELELLRVKHLEVVAQIEYLEQKLDDYRIKID